MKVLVISHMYPSTLSEIAGIFIHKQVKERQKLGCEVKVISPTPWAPFPIKHFSRKLKRSSAVPAKMVWDGIEIYYPRFLQFPRSLFFASSGKRMYSGIRKLVDELYQDFKFDIIHAHVALPDGFAGMMVKKKYNKPLVVTIHGADLHTTIHRNDACRRAVAQVFGEADRIVTVSTGLKQIARSSIGFPEKLIVNNNGINPEDITLGNTELASRYAGSQVILSVAYLITRKGLDFNIKAISQLAERYPNMKYLVIGDGPKATYLKRLASDLGIQNQVEFLGELPHSKVMEYMALTDILSLPSWNEALGNVYLEAMAHGKPVIACEGEGIEDVIENNKTGLLVKPQNVESLAQAMDFLLGNPDKAREIGERAKKLVLENYTWEKNARRYIEIYEELLKHVK
jgi:teichuronic acid biosynthesis glycosyltransferase TuaC